MKLLCTWSHGLTNDAFQLRNRASALLPVLCFRKDDRTHIALVLLPVWWSDTLHLAIYAMTSERHDGKVGHGHRLRSYEYSGSFLTVFRWQLQALQALAMLLVARVACAQVRCQLYTEALQAACPVEVLSYYSNRDGAKVYQHWHVRRSQATCMKKMEALCDKQICLTWSQCRWRSLTEQA